MMCLKTTSKAASWAWQGLSEVCFTPMLPCVGTTQSRRDLGKDHNSIDYCTLKRQSCRRCNGTAAAPVFVDP
jgi:hypothetical protein